MTTTTILPNGRHPKQQPFDLPAAGDGWKRIAPTPAQTVQRLLRESLRIRKDDPAPAVPASLLEPAAYLAEALPDEP